MNLFISILWNWYHEILFLLNFLYEVDSYKSTSQVYRPPTKSDNLGYL